MRNERVNVKIVDDTGQFWYMSIVGGPAVGTIVMDSQVYRNATVIRGQELAKFLLGSTCCIASPLPCSNYKQGDRVFMGDTY